MKRLLALFFILLGCILITLGGAMLSGVFFLRGSDVPDAFAWKPPLESVDPRALASGTILLPLTGTSASDSISAALDQAHLENAFAIAAYDPFLADSARLGALLQLGTRYASAKDTRKAALAFQTAAQLATLSPALADAARLDSYLQAGVGLRGLGANDAARWVTDQAYLLAEYTPSLQREQRARRLEQVANAYTALNAGALSSQARAKALEASTASATAPITGTRAPFVPTAGKLPPSPEVDNARAQRVMAAKQLQDDLIERAPKSAKEWDADLIVALGDALIEEDGARQAYYDKQIAQTKDDAVQLALRRDKIVWLALKYRVARGALGAPLVVEWEKDRTAMADELSAAWDEFFQLAQAQAARLPEAERAPAQEDLLRQELFVVRWGLYPGQPEQSVLEKISEVTLTLMDAAYPELRLDVIKRNNRALYILLPDDLYGRGEKALPK
ncbi:MAG: hypothetical protein L0Y55_15490 [Anaerolineales bacterium]|nr:hypothetical protein [Anaerolineales bacterium]